MKSTEIKSLRTQLAFYKKLAMKRGMKGPEKSEDIESADQPNVISTI